MREKIMYGVKKLKKGNDLHPDSKKTLLKSKACVFITEIRLVHLALGLFALTFQKGLKCGKWNLPCCRSVVALHDLTALQLFVNCVRAVYSHQIISKQSIDKTDKCNEYLILLNEKV